MIKLQVKQKVKTQLKILVHRKTMNVKSYKNKLQMSVQITQLTATFLQFNLPSC